MTTPAKAIATRRNYTRNAGRPPDAVIDERIAEVFAILSKRPNVHRCQLHKEFCKSWKCHWRTVERAAHKRRMRINRVAKRDSGAI